MGLDAYQHSEEQEKDQRVVLVRGKHRHLLQLVLVAVLKTSPNDRAMNAMYVSDSVKPINLVIDQIP